jgi:hypothetical protein
MNINQVALSYLKVIEDGAEVEGGICFGDEIPSEKLDYSLNSLMAIDGMLTTIRNKHGVEKEWIDEQHFQNLVYLVGFYAGFVISHETGVRVNWYQYEDLKNYDPKLPNIIEECFGTSIFCLHSGALYLPLSKILGRLYDSDDDSVWYSASGQIKMIKERMV